MTTLLHISASPAASALSPSPSRPRSSTSYATNPNVTVENWDLWDGSLPEFGPPAAAAKMAIFGGGADPEGRRGHGVARRAQTPSSGSTRRRRLLPVHGADVERVGALPSSSSSSTSSASPA